VSWNVKFQESNEWKSKVTRDVIVRCYSSDEEDSDDEEVDEDEACYRTKKVIPSQDQPHYHILMVDTSDEDEDNPQFQLNVPEGNQLCVSGSIRINIK
jgi:F-box protein 21